MNDLSTETEQALYELIFAGRKIEAIKLAREAMGLDLKEAKDFVEDLEKELRVESPEKFSKSARAGCMGVIAASLLAAAMLWR